MKEYNIVIITDKLELTSPQYDINTKEDIIDMIAWLNKILLLDIDPTDESI
jgi:hypothetical protein